ncbi:MAG TPA: SseB family protein [Pedococcus sp.]|nr:SseB family protein [Pedococcus sp.]
MSEGPHDSAGTPWSGRELTGTGFDHDTGEADPALARALHDPGDERALMTAVAVARLLVPVVAEPVELEESGGLVAEKQTDMAAVTLVAPDGQRALPVFTSIESLSAWDPRARPVPVTAARAAQAAVSERCDVVVVDVAGPRTAVLRPSMVWALAQQRAWLPAHEDPSVARAVEVAVAPEAAVRGHALAAGRPSGQGILGIVLELAPGLSSEEVEAIATRVGERLATDGELRARVDGLSFSIR